MPYKIVPFKNGYRVKSINGKYLSKHPLTYQNAHDQLVAVSLHEGLFKGSGQKPTEKEFFEATKQSYNITNDASKSIDDFDLILEQPTIKVYLNKSTKTIILAIRGTKPTDSLDLKADGMIAFNNLKNSNRYKNDKNILISIFNQYSPNEYDYYLTGHSLAGAIIAQLKREYNFLKDAVVYNPASQPYDYISQQSDQIKRIYTENDPLYALGATIFKNKLVIPTNRTILPSTKSINPLSIGVDAYNYYQGHALDNFNSLYGGSLHHPEGELHAIIFKKPISLETVYKDTREILKKNKIPFIRETQHSYRVRNIPKTKFQRYSFRTKVINPNISLIFGNLI
jgi:hypothetical protein